MSVEALTDAELRSKLAEYGYPVGPVTLTTRKILAKKLKNLIEAREAGSKGSRHSLAARYSSDDTDDDTSLVSRKKKSGSARRQTLANPMPPPAPAPAPVPKSPTKRRTPSRSNNHNLSVVSEPYVRLDASDREINKLNTSDGNTSYMSSPTIVGKTVKTVQRKVTKTYKSSSNDGLETGSDSDISNEPEKGYSGSKYNCNGPKVYDSGVSGVSGSSSRTSREYSKGDYETPPKPYESKQRSIFTMREESYPPPIFKTSVSPILPVRENNYIRDSSAKDDPLANVETPYLSDFTRRLSRLSSSNLPVVSKTNLPSPILRHSPEVKETDSNGHYASLRTTYPSSGLSSRYVSPTLDRPREAVTRSFRSSTDGKETKNNQNLISMVLVAVVAIFFAVLAVVYLGLGGKAETFPPEHPDNNIPYCSAEVMDGNKPGVNCVLRNSIDTAQQLLKRLQPILVNRAIGFNCEAHDEPPYLTDSDVINMFNKDNLKDWEVKEDLHNAQVLIFKNPKWGISLIEVDEMNKAANQVLESMDQVFMNRLDGKVGMVVPNPDLPLRCLIKNKLYTVLSSLLVVAVGLLGAIGVHKSVVWYFKQKKQAEGEVFRLVSEIISMLELHHQNTAVASPGGTQESYLAINHVRDNLIPPKDRKRMSSVWEKAVVFLDENESRVRREVQQVAGEEFHVWRWLPSNNLNTSTTQVGSPGSKKTKVWQGQAFETMEGSVNSLPCSPTPCLKIRHMFDPDVEFEEDWETKVQDAILEKCGEGVKILHIRVDRGNREGCVYMKCMSQEDAGKAYRALHGWWFDSNLVTVKYLRLERYHERFPDATRCVIPLKPSNNQRLSMQAHYWQSPLETN